MSLLEFWYLNELQGESDNTKYKSEYQVAQKSKEKNLDCQAVVVCLLHL